MAAMKKTYYYGFLLPKNEEVVTTSNHPPQTTRTLVEIRDEYSNPTMQHAPKPAYSDPNVNPWRIRKRVEAHEVLTGKILLTHEQVFEHVFRHSSLESAKNVVAGNKVYATVCDVTDENTPIMYGPYDDQTFFEKGLNDEYVLGLNMNLVKFNGLKKDDEIGIYFEPKNQVFYFKIFS